MLITHDDRVTVAVGAVLNQFAANTGPPGRLGLTSVIAH